MQLPPIPQSISIPKLARPPAFLRHNSRKRLTRSDELQDEDVLSCSLHTSSDPALFSSDETPDAENYIGGKRRKKKTYAGTWWGERLRSGSKSASSHGSSKKGVKRKFKRNFDSGIFMNSDEGSSMELSSSDSSFGQELFEEQRREAEMRTPKQQKFESPVHRLLISPAASPQRIKTTVQVNAAQQQVVNIVRDCLENSKEDVNLVNMALDTLPLEIRELATMIKDDVADQMRFESLVARVRLYLASNALRQLPSPILELSNLRLLSLRQNKLTRLPAGIRELKKLESLNIAGNRLQFLPIEVLDLMTRHRLHELLSYPNSWFEYPVVPGTDPLPSRLTSRPQSCTNTELRRGDTKLELMAKLMNNKQLSTSKATPLAEIVLRQLSKLNSSKRDLAPLMPEDTPTTVTDMLRELFLAQAEGGRKCVDCKRPLVIPAQTWIEWWKTTTVEHLARNSAIRSLRNQTEQILPYEVSVCSECI